MPNVRYQSYWARKRREGPYPMKLRSVSSMSATERRHMWTSLRKRVFGEGDLEAATNAQIAGAILSGLAVLLSTIGLMIAAATLLYSVIPQQEITAVRTQRDFYEMQRLAAIERRDAAMEAAEAAAERQRISEESASNANREAAAATAAAGQARADIALKVHEADEAVRRQRAAEAAMRTAQSRADDAQDFVRQTVIAGFIKAAMKACTPPAFTETGTYFRPAHPDSAGDVKSAAKCIRSLIAEPNKDQFNWEESRIRGVAFKMQDTSRLRAVLALPSAEGVSWGEISEAQRLLHELSTDDLALLYKILDSLQAEWERLLTPIEGSSDDLLMKWTGGPTARMAASLLVERFVVREPSSRPLLPIKPQRPDSEGN